MKVRSPYANAATVIIVSAVLITSLSQFTLFAHVHAAVSEPITLPITHFCAGTNFGCVAFNNNKVKCWGREEAFGFHFTSSYADSLGDALNEVGNNLPYIDISNPLNDVIEGLFCGGVHICVKFQSNGLKCLGKNKNGQTGQGVTNSFVGSASGHIGSNLPYVNIGTGLQVLDASLGFSHSCAIVTGNIVKCFGHNGYGQLGYGDTSERGKTASSMGDNLAIVNLGTGVEIASIHADPLANHNCVIVSKPVVNAQKIKCWGENNSNNLGYGDFTSRGSDPSTMGDALGYVDLGTNAKAKNIKINSFNTCVLLDNDALKCWGYNYYGELSTGDNNPVLQTGDLIPVFPVDSGKFVKLFSFGYNFFCILYDDEVTLKCSGNGGYGQLGQGDPVSIGYSPTTKIPSVPAINLGTTKKIVSIQTGRYTACVLFENSLIKCWGKNNIGQLGIGSTDQVGDIPNQMGTNLEYVKLFSPTNSPSKSPTNKPSKTPTSSTPTKSPTFNPTNKPTTGTPTKTPSTAAPTTGTPTKHPVTATPTKAPVTATPTKAPVTTPPTKAPTTTSPTAGQTTLRPTTASPTTASMGLPSTRATIATMSATLISFIILIVA